MTTEAQIWKDRYFALKKWVEDNIPPESQKDKEHSNQSPTGEWNDFWESREK